MASRGDGNGDRVGERMASREKMVRVWGKRLGFYVGGKGCKYEKLLGV